MVRGKGVVCRRVRVLPPGREAEARACWAWECGLARVKRVMAAVRAAAAAGLGDGGDMVDGWWWWLLVGGLVGDGEEMS